MTGTFTPFQHSERVTTGAVVAGLQHHHSAVGTINFDIAGTAARLIASACPVAPPANRLAVAVKAGEKEPRP